jgi:hypothetical protein
VEEIPLHAAEECAAVHRARLRRYFTYFLFFAVVNQQWLSVPFLVLFQSGFTYVAFCSLAQWIPALRFRAGIRVQFWPVEAGLLLLIRVAARRLLNPFTHALFFVPPHRLSLFEQHHGVRCSRCLGAAECYVDHRQRSRSKDGRAAKRPKVASYSVSTSKFGLGDRPRSYATPLGKLMVAQKVGENAPEGAVFKGRRPTGEILKPNAKGRDPIVTRILYLRGMEPQNASAFDRAIYIHGTPEERRIGRPASYGCVRMKSRDVVKVFNASPVGTTVEIVNQPLRQVMKEIAAQRRAFHRAS